jgi:hypothetical protein
MEKIPPKAMPHQADIPNFDANIPAVYAPTPKKIACPKETCPVYPARRFHEDPITTHIKIIMTRCW